MKIAIIGGGASGYFCANELVKNKNNKIVIFERLGRVLEKVKVSGGGRCNVTNSEIKITTLIKSYPRGDRFLKKAFAKFSTQDTQNWFDKKGVALKTEPDGRVFPVTDKSHTITNCLRDVEQTISLRNKENVDDIVQSGTDWIVNGESFDKVVIASGSAPKMWGILKSLGVKIISPVPSLFTFKIKDNRLDGLMGVSLPQVNMKIVGDKQKEIGGFLVTHWGLSGPVVLKLSAWKARWFYDLHYKFDLFIDYIPNHSEEEIRKEFNSSTSQKIVYNNPLYDLPKRLWKKLCETAEIEQNKIYIELSKKQKNKLLTELKQGVYYVNGKTTFKEEFVTAGGVDLDEITGLTMEHKTLKGLYFAGEVLNIDAITGGYNFQAAWTTAWLAAQAVLNKKV